MKKLLLAGVALVSLVTAASAADLAARPYTKAPALVSPGYNWSGFYAGVMGGYAWQSDLKGGFGGGTIGYNWQAPGSQFVFGLEVDAAGSDLKATQSQFVPGSGWSPPKTRSAHLEASRAVCMASPSMRLCSTKGGYAWADNKPLPMALVLSPFQTAMCIRYRRRRPRIHVRAELVWKIEYMYANLSSENYSFAPGVTLLRATSTSTRSRLASTITSGERLRGCPPRQ